MAQRLTRVIRRSYTGIFTGCLAVGEYVTRTARYEIKQVARQLNAAASTTGPKPPYSSPAGLPVTAGLFGANFLNAE